MNPQKGVTILNDKLDVGHIDNDQMQSDKNILLEHFLSDFL